MSTKDMGCYFLVTVHAFILEGFSFWKWIFLMVIEMFRRQQGQSYIFPLSDVISWNQVGDGGLYSLQICGMCCTDSDTEDQDTGFLGFCFLELFNVISDSLKGS